MGAFNMEIPMCLKRKSFKNSFIRTIIFMIGHFVVSVVCVKLITDIHLHLAMADAIIEPVLNAFWFFLLDRMWTESLPEEVPTNV